MQKQERQNENSAKTSGRTSPIIIACVVLVVLVIVLIGVVLVMLNREPEATAESVPSRETIDTGRATLVTEDNVQDILAEIEEEEKNGDEAYTASMNVDWYFEDGASPSRNAYVENFQTNSRTVYFDLLLADTMELVYSSPYIPVGAVLEGFTLEKDLDAGDYNAIVEYHLVDEEEQEVSTVSVSVTLHILN